MGRKLFVFLFLYLTAGGLCAQQHGQGEFATKVIKVSPREGALRNAIARAAKTDGDVTILLSSGEYRVASTLEITAAQWNSLTIKAAEGAEVSVCGDRFVSPQMAVKVTDPSVLKRIQPAFREKIRVIDFKRLGIELSDIRPSGFGRKSLPAWSELIVDGEPLKLSRWPNDSMVLIGKVEVPGNVADKKEGRLPVFHYKESRPERWKEAQNIWIAGYFGHGYADDMIPVERIDCADSTIYAGMFTTYEFMTGTDFRRWYALNLIEEIDLPGEYALDAAGGKIYFYPPEESCTTIRLTSMSEPIFAIENCRNVTLQGITIENARGIGVYLENTENVVVDGCVLRNLGNVAVCVGKGASAPDNATLVPHAMEAGGEPCSRMVGDMMGRIYEDVALNRVAGKNNGVRNSYIYNVGAGGISLGGGDRMTLSRADNFVENCKISNYNRIEKSYRPGVWMDGVGCRISKCDIFDAPSMAILFHGNDHLIELCKITNVCTEVDDQGAIYYGRDPAERGHVIRYNYFKDLSPRHRVTATYHDDGACGSEVYGNIYFRAGSLPVLIGGGQDHNYHGNLFISSPVAVHIDNRLQNWAKSMADEGGIYQTRIRKVNYTEAPYGTAYPELATYWNEDRYLPKRNTVHGNLFYKVGNVLNGQSSWGEFWNNWATDHDPGFVDENDPLKGFREDAEIFRKIENFEPIPFDRIGSTLK